MGTDLGWDGTKLVNVFSKSGSKCLGLNRIILTFFRHSAPDGDSPALDHM